MTTYVFWETIANIPWWLYLLGAYIIHLCYQATKPRIVIIKKLFYIPAFILAFSVINLATRPPLAAALLLWLSGICIGTGIGWLQFRLQKVKAIKNTNKLYLPGSWSLFGIILMIYAFRYSYGYEAHEQSYALFSQLIYGLLVGLFAGRIIYAFRCRKTGPYQEA